jgi:hypothetical protein
VGGLWFQGYSGLHRDFQASLGYIATPFLKNQTSKQIACLWSFPANFFLLCMKSEALFCPWRRNVFLLLSQWLFKQRVLLALASCAAGSEMNKAWSWSLSFLYSWHLCWVGSSQVAVCRPPPESPGTQPVLPTPSLGWASEPAFHLMTSALAWSPREGTSPWRA